MRYRGYSGLQPGDEVIVSISVGERKIELIERVKRITRTGFIEVGSDLFSPANGVCLDDADTCLELATSEKIRKIRESKYVRKILNAMNSHGCEITYEQAKAIGEIIGIPT